MIPTNHRKRKQRNEPTRIQNNSMYVAGAKARENTGVKNARENAGVQVTILVLVLLLVGLETGASFSNQSLSEPKKHQS